MATFLMLASILVGVAVLALAFTAVKQTLGSFWTETETGKDISDSLRDIKRDVAERWPIDDLDGATKVLTIKLLRSTVVAVRFSVAAILICISTVLSILRLAPRRERVK
jgi:hypothetical protein